MFSVTRPIRKKIQAQLFGPGFRFAISGGAKLPEVVAEFFCNLEIPICEGYGLTETCVATHVNLPESIRLGTVGPPLASDIEVKLLANKEICIRGPNVAIGYFNCPAETAESWDEEGWFHTGDMGTIDSDGYLSIVGRLKEVIVPTNGKNIYPTRIEQVLETSPYISHAVLVGDNRPYLTSLLTLDVEALKPLGLRPETLSKTSLRENETLYALISSEIARINLQLANYEKIRAFRILPTAFTIDNGLLTPTLKVKRQAVLKQFAEDVEDLYFDSSVV